MTQFEYDSRREQINRRDRQMRNAARSEWAHRRNAIDDTLNQARGEYNRKLVENQLKLDEILKERLELKRQGLEPHHPHMEANYQAERNVHQFMRADKNYLDQVRHRAKRESQSVEIWYMEEMDNIKKQIADELLELTRQREEDNKIKLVEP